MVSYNVKREFFARRNVFCSPYGTHVGNNILHGVDSAYYIFVTFSKNFFLHDTVHDAFAFFSFAQVLPKLFGNERHERVKQL